VLFADTDIVNYIMQGGALSLLGYLIVWQFPQMMRDIRSEREAVASERRSKDELFTTERKESLARFEGVINLIQEKQDQRNLGLISGIKEQTLELGQKLDEHTKAISAAVLSVCKAKLDGR
jgi:hypothetical protein